MTRVVRGFYDQGGANMLVLSRKQGQEIVVGSGITVTVLAVSGGRVRLGIVAPAEVPIHREEIQRRIEGSPSSCRLAGCL
jgi:carbon storage regulator